jgi:nitrate/nitrite-specific signal transduction histidine kinase
MIRPYNSYQLKDIADEMESYRVDQLWHYNVATSNTKEARRLLFAILRDDDQRELVFSDNAYKDLVESRTRFLQERRHQEKERLEQYLVYEERAIAARKMHRDEEAEEPGGWTYDTLSRPNLVWIPGPDHY